MNDPLHKTDFSYDTDIDDETIEALGFVWIIGGNNEWNYHVFVITTTRNWISYVDLTMEGFQ